MSGETLEARSALTIREALTAVMEGVGAVRKEERNNAPGANFNFRGIDAVVNAVSPELRKHGVVVTPHLQSLERRAITTSNGKAMNGVDVVVRYVFTGPDGDRLEATVPGEAFDSGDKATAKAMSVAFRTALLQALALPTDEVNPDAEAPQGAVRVDRAPQGQPDPPPPPTMPAAAERALTDGWNNLPRLQALHRWYTDNGGTEDYMNRLTNRIHTLTNGASQ